MDKVIRDRFWSRVDIAGDNDCWNWLAGKCQGYGHFCLYGSNRRAHRISYMWANDIIRPDQLVLHKCGNRSCVNPAHLYIGSWSDNQRDVRGNSNVKFTSHAIASMKRMYFKYMMKQRDIAKIFKTDQSTISRAVNNIPSVGR